MVARFATVETWSSAAIVFNILEPLTSSPERFGFSLLNVVLFGYIIIETWPVNWKRGYLLYKFSEFSQSFTRKTREICNTDHENTNLLHSFILDSETPGGRLNIETSSYQNKNFHCKDMTVSRPSYPYKVNPYTLKDGRYIERWPCSLSEYHIRQIWEASSTSWSKNSALKRFPIGSTEYMGYGWAS